MNLSCANSALMGAAAALVGHDLFQPQRFTSKRAAMEWASRISAPKGSAYGRVYMIVTDGCVKLGSSAGIAKRFEAHFAKGPTSYYPFRYVVVSDLRDDYRRLERQILGLCATIGVPHFGAAGTPYGREFFAAGHPLFENLDSLLTCEIDWTELIDLVSGNARKSHEWRRRVLSNVTEWFSPRRTSPPPCELAPA